MDKVEQKVNEILNRVFVGKKYDLHYGTSFDGIPYGLLTTTVVWYKVWIICCVKKNNEVKDASIYGTPIADETILVRDIDCFTNSGWSTFLKDCKEELVKGINTCLFNPDDLVRPRVGLYISLRKLPADAAKHPDNHLKPGDLVHSTFAKAFYHAGIYIGNGEVVHVSGHGGGKDCSVARIGQLIGDFVEPGGKLWVLKCVYRFREAAKIVAIAKEYAANGFRRGEYNIIGQNCQHFASLCAFGFEYSLETTMDEVL